MVIYFNKIGFYYLYKGEVSVFFSLIKVMFHWFKLDIIFVISHSYTMTSQRNILSMMFQSELNRMIT